MEVKVKISEAVAALVSNREKHTEDYKEALDVWRKAIADYTKTIESWAENAGVGERPHQPTAPRNYLGEYNKLIKKLNFHQDETILLNDSEYNTIFEDQFWWQNQFQRQKAPIYTMGSANPRDFTGSVSTGQLLTNSHLVDKISLNTEDGLHVPIGDE